MGARQGGSRTHESASAAALRSAYRQNGTAPVAYVDETYQIERTPHFYVTTAVVVQSDQRDVLRCAIEDIVEVGRWHTTDALRTEPGRHKTHELLQCLAEPDGSEVAVVSHRVIVDIAEDRTGEDARAASLTVLMSEVNATLGVDLFVLERRFTQKLASRDARTRAEALRAGVLPPQVRLVQVSPADESLLWLPDLVCSAYRQKITGRDASLFDTVSMICRILPGT